MKTTLPTVKESYELLAGNEKIKTAGHRFTMRLELVLAVFSVLIVSGLLTALFVYLLYINNIVTERGTTINEVVLISLVFSLVVSTIMTYVAWPLIFRPLDNVRSSMSKAAQGDFSGFVPDDKCRGDVKILVCAYNDMLRELSGIEMFREDFISNFSHEFKTPIVSIHGFADQLLREDLSEEQKSEYARMIVEESSKLTNMSSSILLLTKLESQEVVSGRAMFSLDEQLRECLLRYQNQWESKNLELDLSLEPVSYFGNAKMLEHIWTNLISNAIKFSHPGGTLGLGCTKKDDRVIAWVSDTGVGMDENTADHIFEKFYQGDAAHASAGNGLGLSIVGRVVQLNGGKISVQSAIGQGSLFVVTLPVSPLKSL